MTKTSNQLRPFADLINEIEVSGERFVPIERIAMLAFNYNLETVQKRSRAWVNEHYDNAAHYLFETDVVKPLQHVAALVIWPNFDIWCYHHIGAEQQSKTTQSPSNQIEITKSLVKWGFVHI